MKPNSKKPVRRGGWSRQPVNTFDGLAIGLAVVIVAAFVALGWLAFHA